MSNNYTQFKRAPGFRIHVCLPYKLAGVLAMISILSAALLGLVFFQGQDSSPQAERRLVAAAREGKLNAVKQLVANGVNVDSEDKTGTSAPRARWYQAVADSTASGEWTLSSPDQG